MISEMAAQKSLLSQHAVHLLSIGIPVGMVAAGLAFDSLRKRRRRARDVTVLRQRPLLVAATACVGAAAIHAWVMPEHFRESLLYGAFFGVLAAAQLMAAWVVAIGRSRAVVVAVAVGSAGVILLWFMTRLVAIPLGPAAGQTESFGALDIAASIFELVALVGCLSALRPAQLQRRQEPARPIIRERVPAR